MVRVSLLPVLPYYLLLYPPPLRFLALSVPVPFSLALSEPCLACPVSDGTNTSGAKECAFALGYVWTGVPGLVASQSRPTFCSNNRRYGLKLIWVIHSGISGAFHKLPVWRRGAIYCSSPTTVPTELLNAGLHASAVPSQCWWHAPAADAAADDATHVPVPAEWTSHGHGHTTTSIQPSAGYAGAVDSFSAGTVRRTT